MSYHTKFKLSTINDPDSEHYNQAFDLVIKYTAKKSVETFVENYFGISYLFDGSEYSWYEHESDMKKISREFPGVLFLLEGEGEEAGDLWKKYFRSGKMQTAKAVITFEPFDESKLK